MYYPDNSNHKIFNFAGNLNGTHFYGGLSMEDPEKRSDVRFFIKAPSPQTIGKRSVIIFYTDKIEQDKITHVRNPTQTEWQFIREGVEFEGTYGEDYIKCGQKYKAYNSEKVERVEYHEGKIFYQAKNTESLYENTYFSVFNRDTNLENYQLINEESIIQRPMCSIERAVFETYFSAPILKSLSGYKTSLEIKNLILSCIQKDNFFEIN